MELFEFLLGCSMLLVVFLVHMLPFLAIGWIAGMIIFPRG